MERSVEATATLGAAADEIVGLLCRDPRAALGASANLEASVGLGPTLHRKVALTVGRPTRTADGVRVPLAWRAEAHADLFPTFDGELSVEPSSAATRVRLTGTYAVPLGLLGRFGDGVLGRRVAQQSVAAWLECVARRLDVAAGASSDAGYEIGVCEPTGSEISVV